MTKRELIKKVFGDFKYSNNTNGSIIIESEWIINNIVEIKLPYGFKTWGHKLVANRIKNSIWEGKNYIDWWDYKSNGGGCWVARHIGWNKHRPLSYHSWGIAVDVNIFWRVEGIKKINYGNYGMQPKRLIQIFEKYGFIWGGNWRMCDGMHWEISTKLCRELLTK